MDNKGYLLLVEDDPVIQANNKQLLERRGYVIKQAFRLKEARAIIAEEPPRAIILDIELPDGSGLNFLRELRETSNIPVLMLTGRGTQTDIQKGLNDGSDIYLTKPYELPTFLSNLEALLRRSAIIPETLTFGPFKLEISSSTAYINGENMVLAGKEFALLQQFIQHPNTPLSAEYLYEKVWGQDMAGDDGALKTSVYRLRKKLRDSGYTITAEYGAGYIFEYE